MDVVNRSGGKRPLKDLRVHYEVLVADQEPHVRRMMIFTGVPSARRSLDSHKNRRYARTASYAQVTEKLYDRSRNRYKPYLKHLAPVVPILEPVIQRLGYRIDEGLIQSG